jgi:hypothetical protein
VKIEKILLKRIILSYSGGYNMKVEGFFRDFKSANEVVSKLKHEGYSKSFVDINEHYNAINVQTNNVGTATAPSLSGLVLKSGESAAGLGLSPLTAASPMVSGMGGFEEIADINCKVVVETDDINADRVKEIINSMGGDLNNPNINLPKRLENIKLEDIRLEDVNL